MYPFVSCRVTGIKCWAQRPIPTATAIFRDFLEYK